MTTTRLKKGLSDGGNETNQRVCGVVMLVILIIGCILQILKTLFVMEEMRQIREFKDVYVIIVNYGDVFCKYKISYTSV